MPRRGPVPWKGKRQRVTLMIDVKAYRQVRKIVDAVPGISVSDIVSDLLLAVVDDLLPHLKELGKAKNHTERLAVLERLYAELSGAQALEFARAYSAIQATREEEEKEA